MLLHKVVGLASVGWHLLCLHHPYSMSSTGIISVTLPHCQRLAGFAFTAFARLHTAPFLDALLQGVPRRSCVSGKACPACALE